MRVLTDQTAHNIRIPARCQHLPGYDLIPDSGSFCHNGCCLLRPDKRACGDQVKFQSLCCNPVPDPDHLIVPFFRETPVCIALVRPCILCFAVSQDIKVHKRTLSTHKNMKIVMKIIQRAGSSVLRP